MVSFAEGRAGVIDVADMERRNMSMAERDQCALDDFWGTVANQVEQAEATAAMEREDRRSQEVRARIKKEERYRPWEQEDLRRREIRNVVRENLEDAARREYLEIFYRAPSVDMAMNYSWPTRASLGQTLDQQLSNSWVGDAEVPWAATHSGVGGGSLTCPTARGGDEARPAPSTGQSSRDIHSGWSNSGCSGEESSSTRPFHVFHGKKTYQAVSVIDCFVPPRHLSEPTTKDGLVSVHAIAAAACAAGGQTTAGLKSLDPAATAASCGRSKSVRLPPMVETPRGGWPTARLARPRAAGGGARKLLSFNKSQLRRRQSPAVPSFERKLEARREQWSREAEAEAKERALRAQWRAQAVLRDLQGLDAAGKGRGDGVTYFYRDGVTRFRCPSTPAESGCRSNGNDRQGCVRSHGWRPRGDCRQDEGNVTELIPERERTLLTQMFCMLDARDRGEVRLDEVLFYMTKNAQVKSVLKQVTLWMLTKTRRWAWVEELFEAQPSRTLTLHELLAFSRSLHEESHVPRKHLRLAKKLREVGAERRDIRSKRLLPADFVEGTEVEAIFRKGCEWYRAWIVRCHPDDTFDVRFTRPPPLESDESSSRRGGGATGEQRPEVETSSRLSESEEGWNSDEENSTLTAEEEWKATCDRVAQFIGGAPDLGETETEILEKAFDAIASLVSPTKANPTPAADERRETHAVGEIRDNGALAIAHPRTTPKRQAASPQALGRRQQREDEGNSERKGGDHDINATPDDADAAPRIPAKEIIRLLHSGAIEGYRRASPALSATCIYREFAEGLKGAVARRDLDSAARGSGLDNISDTDDHAAKVCDVNKENSNGGQDIGSDERGWGVSKEEFCEYFEAVTDLVDLNDLSLVPHVQQRLALPWVVGA